MTTAVSSPYIRLRIQRLVHFLRHQHFIFICSFIIVVLILIALLSPWFTRDPLSANPFVRLKPPSSEYLFGTDGLGRDVFARTVQGTRVSLVVGFSAAILATCVGLIIGMLTGYIRIIDFLLMRVMDALMAIPGVLMAIALMTLFGSSVTNVIIAISIPEIPGIARLVRSIVLSLREQAYIKAAECIGTRLHKILLRHILPNILAPLIVQASYVFAGAVISEAILSFLGAGTPPEVPSWGNMVAEGRLTFLVAPWVIFFPSAFLALLVFIINILGDALRDTLDPRLAKELV
jgi:peptide/nickel transport system permease protein